MARRSSWASDTASTLEAVQFHPESVLTAVGHDVIENFLESLEDA